ncbi:MAG TPA: hypothetical protein VL155_14005 [Terriglobales bacterium]|jgi:hypothetical protein|nr:hypothetical protein [Terriglobales bacterium]
MLWLQRPVMMVPTFISYLIWVVGGLGTLVALGLTLRRGLLGGFPFFFFYLLFHAVDTVSAFLILRYLGRASLPYYYEYWGAQAVGLGLRFAVIYEIFSHVLRPYEGLRRGSTLVLRWVGVILILAGIGVALAGPSNEPIWAVQGALVIQRSIDVVQCGLLVVLFLAASYFALTWRNYVFGIALGFGVIATMELLASAIAAQSSPVVSGVILNSVPRVAYGMGTIIWIVYLALPEPSRLEIKLLPQHDLEKWNQELLQLLER